MIDQLEFENLIEKIKRRREEGDYKTASRIADKIPWDEIKDINVLMFAANIYEDAENYKDAKIILEYAYDLAPVKNRLYYALSLVNVECKELKEAVNYYIDFCNAFPEDNRKLLLKYYILKAKGAPFEQQKRVLYEYIKEEKDEKMSFEMALLSDKLGQKEDVIYYCDFITNFFGVKKTGYGKNALLLKKKYIELTDDEEKLLVDSDIGFIRDEEKNIEYKEPTKLYNETKIDEDKINIPVEKVERITDIEEQRKISELISQKEDELDEKKINNNISISYTPDEESYDEKEKNDPAFMNSSVDDKSKLKKLINELKQEERIANSPFNKYRQKSFSLKRRHSDMKLSETKLHMVIEAHSKEEGIDIAQKELNYIHDVLGEKFSIAKASAYNMNEKGFSFYIDKIKDRDLIIENAGQLKNDVVDDIEEYIINKKGKTIFALVDVINNFDKLATDRPSFVGRFDVYSVLSNRPQETLDVSKKEIDDFKAKRDNENVSKNANEENDDKKAEMPKNSKKSMVLGMTVDDFVEECKNYAKSIDCVLPGSTIPALYEKAEDMKEQKIKLSKENAIALIEEAADRAEKPKLFSKPKYDKEGCLIISEEHLDF